MSLALQAAKRRRGRQGDLLGLGKILSGVGGFIPGIGGVIQKVGGIVQNIGGAKVQPAITPVISGSKVPRALPGGAMIAPMFPQADSVKVTGTSIGLLQGYNTGSATAYYSNGKKRKKYRKINPLNPKALTRSIKRLSRFGDFAKSMGYSRPPASIRHFKAPAKRRRVAKCR